MAKINQFPFFNRLRAVLVELWVWIFAWIPTPLGMLLRLCAWKFLFARCKNVRFATDITLIAPHNMAFGKKARIGKGCYLSASNGSLQLDDYVAVSPNVNLGADDGEIVIGRYCAIGPGTVIRAANHCFDSLETPISLQGHSRGKVVLEEDVWVGANCVILPDVRIGKGSIVGAGAVVTSDIQPGSIACGVPARIIGARGEKIKKCK